MIVLHAKGQTCNKLFTYSSFISDSFDSNEKIVILSPDITFKDYPSFAKLSFVIFPLYFDSVSRIIGYKRYIKFLRLLGGNKYSLKLIATILKPFPSIKVIIAPTGKYKSKNTEKYKHELRKIFKPRATIINHVNSYFIRVRKSTNIICGVHIRRGDYKFWNNGRYCYTEEQFFKIMKLIENMFSDQIVTFFISSNEKVDFYKFKTVDYFSIPNGEATMDLYGLSLCDYIIGPPSTFSGWASYYGNKPLYFIENPEDGISISSFKYITEIWK